MYIVGVDSGGTKTKSVIVDSHFTILGTGESGSGNYHSVGKDQAKENIGKAISEAISEAGLEMSDIDYGGFGIGGLDTEKDYKIISDFLAELGYGNKRFIVNDVVISHYGVTAGKPGVTIVAGTGSIAYGINKKGEDYRAGGWGWLIGDEGSGFYAARRGLQKVAKAVDGRGEQTKLVELAEDHFQIKNIKEELIPKIYENRPQKIASFATRVTEAASNGDEISLKLVNECCRELVDAVRAVQKELGIKDPVRVGRVGGFISSDIVATRFEEKIKKQIENPKLMKSINHPVVGAISLVANKINKKINVDNIQNMDCKIKE